MKDFLYKTTFASIPKVISSDEENNKQLALASLEPLRGLVPASIDFDANCDAVFCTANAALANFVNKNGDSIDNISAVQIYKNFIHKFCDLEHKRDKIIGSIINAGFSSFGDNTLLTEEDVRNTHAPVNISLAMVVWRVLNEDFADKLIESSDETSLSYNKISLSWELGFESYHILLGSKNLSEAEIITDEKQIKEFSKYLQVNRGTGYTKDKIPVYRKIIGDMYPLGVGMVARPAANVSGVLVVDEIASTPAIPIKLQAEENKSNEVIEINSIDKPLELAAAELAKEGLKSIDVINKINTALVACKEFDPVTIPGVTRKELDFYGFDNVNILATALKTNEKFNESKEILTKNKIIVNNNANENKKCVNKDTNLSNINKNYKKPMKLKLQDITKDTLESIANVDLYELAKDINEQSTKFAVERDAKAAEVDAAKKEVADIKSKSESVAAELEKVKAELAKMEESRAKEKIQTDFNIRMSELNDKYKLDAAQSKSIAKQIRGLDDETFASWLEDHSAFLVAKEMPDFIKEKVEDKKDDKKEDDKKDDKKEEKKESKASLIDEIKALKPETKPIENKITVNKTTQEIWAEAFAGLAEVNDVVAAK